MRISSKGRYALRLMLDLAINDTGEYMPIKNIAKRQEISEKYLEQIISLLSKAGYVKSVRGSQGGYRLAYPSQDYTVGMILRVTEGSLAPVPCLEDTPNECDLGTNCVTLGVWEELYSAITGVVDNITLKDLTKKHMDLVPFNFNI